MATGPFTTVRSGPDGTMLEFEGTSRTRPIAGGLGNLEEAVIHHSKRTYDGMAVRLFDPKAGKWSIWWADESAPMFSPPPLLGSFSAGVGTLFATDPDKPTSMSRFVWKDITATSAVWERGGQRGRRP